MPPVRVAYTKARINLAAAVVRDQEAIVDHKLYWAPSLGEACYLYGFLNSAALQAGVKPFQSQRHWGARDSDKYVFNLPIPRFDKNDKLHRRGRGDGGGCRGQRPGHRRGVFHA